MRFKLDRLSPTGLIRLVAETVLLFLIVWSPWPFASVEFAWESVLISGTAFMAMLWMLHGFFQRQVVIRPDGIAYCLLGLVLLSLFQLIPLPDTIVGALSPARVQLHKQLIPDKLEILPGESGTTARSSWLPLSFDPFLTRVFLAQTLALLLLYLTVRSWLSSRESLRRLAWVCTINGMLLALLGISQFFSSNHHVVYWSVETNGTVFGPFICKNHFTDYVLFCLGLGIGLIVSRQGPKVVKIRGVEYNLNFMGRVTDSPDLFILGSGLVLVVMSIPLTLSRGGFLAALIAAAAVAALVYRVHGKLTRGVVLGGALAFLAFLLGAWYGWGAVVDRLGTIWTGQAGEVRSGLWADVSRLIPGFLATGGGAGTFPRFESLTRTENGPANYIMENAHNEYLEAILEGGILRLVLTIWIIYAAIRYAVVAYLKLRDRSSGPLLLGILFGLIGLAVHSFVDFGIHMPAIALIATVMAAYAADAATDPTYIPFKKKSLDAPKPDPGRRHLRGVPMYAFAAVIAAASLWLVMDSSNRGQAEELKLVARAATRAGPLDQHKIRLETLTTAVARTPTDAMSWMLLAQAHFTAADDERRVAAMALGGVGPVLDLPPQAYQARSGERVTAGLAAARTARGLSPLLPIPHLLLGQYSSGFASSEVPRTHYDRALRICPTDPEIYILRGRDAAGRNDLTAAVADWQKALTLNPQMLPRVLEAARSLTPEQVLTQLLPPDPSLLWAAVEQLHPLWKQQRAPRKPYLERIAILNARDEWSGRGWAAIARANAELGRSDAAHLAWRKAIQHEPDAADLRDLFSRWLEAEERYAEAEEQLDWLRNTRGDSQELMDRLDAVRHGRKLQAIIEGR